MCDQHGCSGHGAAEGITHLEDSRFKVTEWRFAPGAKTGWHVHGHDYVIVPLTDGTLGLDHPDGSRTQAQLKHGIPYSRRTGVEHDVTNDGDVPLAFLEVEVVDDLLEQKRIAMIRRLNEGFNAHDVDAIMATMSEDCVFSPSVGAKAAAHRGQAAVKAAFASLLAGFKDAHWHEEHVSVRGDTGLSAWRFTATTLAGDAVDVQGTDIFAFEGELISLKDSYRKSAG